MQQYKIEQLILDGAHVVPVRPPNISVGGYDRWKHNMAKLEIFNLIEYHRVLAIDSDFILLDSLDLTFDYAAGHFSPCKSACSVWFGCTSLNHSWCMIDGNKWLAAAYDWNWRWLANRKASNHSNYFNAGLLLVKPDKQVYKEIMR